jgi:transposase InsO family protein
MPGKLARPVREEADGKGPEPRAPRRRPTSLGGRTAETHQPKGRQGAAVRPYTEHPTVEGKVYCAAVLDTYSRRIVGWSIDDNMQTTLVVDALGMAIARRQPEPHSAILHSDHNLPLFGRCLRGVRQILDRLQYLPSGRVVELGIC